MDEKGQNEPDLEISSKRNYLQQLQTDNVFTYDGDNNYCKK